jgi:uncharacterized protein (TIGR02452 family)
MDVPLNRVLRTEDDPLNRTVLTLEDAAAHAAAAASPFQPAAPAGRRVAPSPLLHPRAKVLTLADTGDVTAPQSPEPVGSPLSTRTATPEGYTANNGSLLSGVKPVFKVGEDRGRFMTDAESSWDPYLWIRKKNEPSDREARRQGCSATTAACRKCGYELPDRTVALSLDLQTSVIVSDEADIAPPLGAASYSSWITANKETIPAGALRAFQDGFTKVAVVSAASGYHCGGGFSTGGRHALEEALCTSSTLYASLKPLASEKNGKSGGYIPKNGVILSKGVEFFRGSTNEGYPFLDEPWVADVISVAMPNLNPRVQDSPVAQFESTSEYEKVILAKWRAVMVAADQAKVTALCICDAGCGVFQNDASTVGRLLGMTLRSRPSGLQHVYVCAFQRNFFAGVETGLSSDVTTGEVDNGLSMD